MSDSVNQDVFVTVAQFIGSRYIKTGEFKCDDLYYLDISEMTWESFVEKVYDYMAVHFIIQKSSVTNFNAGVRWLKKQKWKD